MDSLWPRVANLWQARLGVTILAESSSIQDLGGTIYFPQKDVDCNHLKTNPYQGYCIWKGNSTYFDFVRPPEQVEKVAWSYPNPKEGVARIKGHLAFDTNKVSLQSIFRVSFFSWRFDF